jgi:hypothetical protein
MVAYLSNEEIILAAERYAEMSGESLGNASSILRHSSEFNSLRATQYNKTDNKDEYEANLIKRRTARVEQKQREEQADLAHVISGLPEDIRTLFGG